VASASRQRPQRVETRRTLAFEIGDVNARLLAAMTAAGFSEDEARAADVHVLTDGCY
jgi:hypothetical protein